MGRIVAALLIAVTDVTVLAVTDPEGQTTTSGTGS